MVFLLILYLKMRADGFDLGAPAAKTRCVSVQEQGACKIWIPANLERGGTTGPALGLGTYHACGKKGSLSLLISPRTFTGAIIRTMLSRTRRLAINPDYTHRPITFNQAESKPLEI
jgi:hypothetical protein